MSESADQVVEQLGRLAEAGVQRVMLQWLALDDQERLEFEAWLQTDPEAQAILADYQVVADHHSLGSNL